MDDPIGRFAGSLLIAIIGIWAVVYLSRHFAENIRDNKVVDQTSSEFDASDRPGMAALQGLGYALAITAAVLAAACGIFNALR